MTVAGSIFAYFSIIIVSFGDFSRYVKNEDELKKGNFSLIANLIMLVGVLTILEATLTLPGIAGIILTVGMAVDANVLIFERIKEELKTEKSIIHAFHIGYSKAKITVLDANITTLIAAVILFAFGSGPVKGFAITLGIGIITTLYSAYFLARHLTSMIILNKKEGEVNL